MKKKQKNVDYSSNIFYKTCNIDKELLYSEYFGERIFFRSCFILNGWFKC